MDMIITKTSDLKEGDVIKHSVLTGEWVVIESVQERQPGPHTEPDFNAWKVIIQKLKKDGTHDDIKGKTKTFYDCGLFMNHMKEAQVVRKMRKRVYYIEETITRKIRKHRFI